MKAAPCSAYQGEKCQHGHATNIGCNGHVEGFYSRQPFCTTDEMQFDESRQVVTMRRFSPSLNLPRSEA